MINCLTELLQSLLYLHKIYDIYLPCIYTYINSWASGNVLFLHLDAGYKGVLGL